MSLTFRVELPDGEFEEHEVMRPGGMIRIAVGERDGRHGGVYRIWSSPNSPDLYIAQRDVAPYQKWSLHKTGDWLYQWVDSERAENRARELGHTGGRVLDRWSQPPELPGTGWTSAFSICTRHQDLVAYDTDSQLPADIRWVRPPPEGTARQLHITILRATAPQAVLNLPKMVPLCGFGLAEDRLVLVLASTHPLTDETNAKINGWVDAARQHAGEGVVEAAAAPRVFVHSIADDGHRMAWDLIVPRDPA